MFGHPISFNYKREGNSHNTICGGLVSILIYAIMLNLIIFKTKTMVLVEDDTITKRELSKNDIATDVISLADMDLNPAFAFVQNKRGKFGITLPVDITTVAQYVKPRYYIKKVDWEAYSIEFEPLKSRSCKVTDGFDLDEGSKAIFKTLN